MLGTGVYVSIALAAEAAGPGLIASIVVAGITAALAATSVIALSTRYPVSGGIYIFARELIHREVGFATGWTFVCAKLASASTAALGITGYLVVLFGLGPAASDIIAPIVVLCLTAAAYVGILFSMRLIMLTLVVSIAALGAFVVAGAGSVNGFSAVTDLSNAEVLPTLHASGLIFLAFSGFGRLATLGEEIREPERNIPIAILVSLIVFALLYVGVAYVAVGTVSTSTLGKLAASDNAPLLAVATNFGGQWLQVALTLGALASMIGIVLNIVLGLSRTALAMSRTGDLPAALGVMRKNDPKPRRATLCVGAVLMGAVACLTARTTWHLGAIGLLMCTAATHLAAFRLPPDKQRYSRFLPLLGLLSCVVITFSIDLSLVATFGAILILGFVFRAGWKALARASTRKAHEAKP
jgi:APA family basic amino acid/polyamine antiporter